ncbi:MAG: hypothetical protein J7L64_01350 [Acidobacteria bacterium]|nr:hypothetical protein [Acidobacteriota bacterium]
MKLEFWIPETFPSEKEIAKILSRLEKVKTKFGFPYEERRFRKESWDQIKNETLLSISVARKIKIPQSRGAKNPKLFLLVLTDDGNPITFYPQERDTRPCKEVKILDFLDGLLKGEALCIDEKVRQIIKREIERGSGK